MVRRNVDAVFVGATLMLAGCGSEGLDEPVGQVALTAEDPPIPDDCETEVAGAKNYWISPDGNDANAGTFAAPKQKLQAVYDAVEVDEHGDLTQSVFVHVDDGVYPVDTLDWTKFGAPESKKRITIEACPGARPIFDGKAAQAGDFIGLAPSSSRATRFTIRGLTIRNFYSTGIRLNASDGKCASVSTSNNTVDGCTFENIGNWQFPDKHFGYAAIHVKNSSHNEITNNSISRVENYDEPGTGEDKDDWTLIHAVYAAHCSSFNTIENNSVERCSGNPISLRDKSNFNTVANNYYDRSGASALIYLYADSGETVATGNEAYGNVATFPHAFSDGSIEKCRKTGGVCTQAEVDLTGQASSALALIAPESEQIAAVVGGDFDGDGIDEIVAAFNYNGTFGGFTKVVSTAGSIGNRHFHRVLYKNGGEGETFFWDVAKLAAGDFDNDGRPELLSAFHAETMTKVYRGDGTSCTGGGSIYTDSSSPYFRVTGMAAGDFDGNGVDEVITAFEKSNSTTIDTGNGVSSLTDGPALFNSSTAPYWRVTAMSAGDFDGNNNAEVITAMNRQGTAPEYKIYSGDGTTQVKNQTLHSDTASPFWATTATVGGDFNDDGTDELVTGMWGGSSYRLHSGNGTTAVTGTQLENSGTFFIRALGRGDFDSNGNLDLVTVIERPGYDDGDEEEDDGDEEEDDGDDDDDLKIVVGNGSSDYDDLWELYSSYFND